MAAADTDPVRVGTAVAMARPFALVNADAGETVIPLPTKLTVVPATGLPKESLTRTVKGIGSRNPTDPDCPLPAETAIEVAEVGADTVTVPWTKAKL